MKKYELIIGSPIDYDELVVYIRINEEHIALVSKDEGVEKMKIEFFGEPLKAKIYLDDFIAALQDAKTELLK